MAEQPLRILMIGGDASLWIGVSSTLGARASHIYVPRETDAANLQAAGLGVDVIVTSMTGDRRAESAQGLAALAEANLTRKTVAIIDPQDRQGVRSALALGVGAVIGQGSTPERLALAIEQVAARGSLYDSHATEELLAGVAKADGEPAMKAARALASALELKDTYTGGHAERVTAMAMRLARVAMLEDALPGDALEMAFLLHDVGKIGIPESILNKVGVLTDTERRVLNTHPILGEKVVAPLDLPPVVRQVIRHHHERWDGNGYPDGLAGREIPAAARLFSIADVIDAMTSVRPYRQPVNLETAVAEVMRQAGSQFDPTLAALVEDAFLDEPVELLADPPF